MKISGPQIFWIMFVMETGMTLLLTMQPAIQEAKQDAWISSIIVGLAAIIMTIVAVRLSMLYPKQTLVQFSQTILGKWFGKMIVLPYFIVWVTVTGMILRQSSDFVLISLFHKTPLWILCLILILLVVYLTHQGIEGIARCAEMFGPICVITIVTLYSLDIPNTEWHHLLPIYAHSGWLQILKGSLAPMGFLGESVMISMLYSFMNEMGKRPSWVYWGVTAASFFLVIDAFVVIMTFGPNLASRMWYPAYEVVRFISMMEFIQNIDALVVIVWILSIFLKLALYLFISSYGAAQWLNLKDWKKPIWVIATVAFVFSMLPQNIVVSTIEYPKKIWTPFVVPITFVGIPLFLLVVGVVRKRISKRTGQSAH